MHTIQLRGGGRLNLVKPHPSAFTIEDVAGALSKICRFGGQTSQFYSVADHSCLCLRIAADSGQPIQARRAVLMHDAAEAFIGDVVTPLKLLLPEYMSIEARINEVIAKKWGIDFDSHKAVVDEIDRIALFVERRLLFASDTESQYFAGSPPRLSEPQFLSAAKEIGIT